MKSVGTVITQAWLQTTDRGGLDDDGVPAMNGTYYIINEKTFQYNSDGEVISATANVTFFHEQYNKDTGETKLIEGRTTTFKQSSENSNPEEIEIR